MKFYTYLWLRNDGTPYYAGKGMNRRAYRRSNHRVRPPVYLDQIIVQYWPSEKDAFAAEQFLIAYYGRIDLGTGCLRNLTDGGEGVPGMAGKKGRIFSPEHRQKLSIAASQRKGSIPWNRGKSTPPEVRLKQRLAKVGKPWTEARRAACL